MARTTIEIPDSTKQKLRDARLEHESNYGETIERLLDSGEVPFTTESEVKKIVSDMVVFEALDK